jgi:hypothetical protein
MYTIEQRLDYFGGEIVEPKNHVFRFRNNFDTGKTWSESFAEFLEQPNVHEVEAIAFGWWFTDPEGYVSEINDYGEEIFEDLPQVIEAIVSSRNILTNIKFLFLLDTEYFSGEEDSYYSDSFTEFAAVEISPLVQAFPKLEYFGLYGLEVTDWGSISSDSLVALEYVAPYAAEGYSVQLNDLNRLQQNHLPNLEILHFDCDPGFNYDSFIQSLLENNPFPKLRRVFHPHFQKVELEGEEDNDDDGDDGENHFYVVNTVRVISHADNYDSPYLMRYGEVRTDFTGE